MNKVGYDLCDGIKKEENVTENYSASWNALLDEGDDEHRRTEVSQMDSEFCVIIIDLHNTSTSYFLFFLFSDLMSIIPWKGIILVKQKYIFKNTLFFLDPEIKKKQNRETDKNPFLWHLSPIHFYTIPYHQEKHKGSKKQQRLNLHV